MDAYAVKIYNFVGAYGEQIVQHSSLRLHMNEEDIKFFRSIHEQIGRPDGSLRSGNIPLIIYHSGYLHKTVTEKKKSERNTPLVQKELESSTNKGFDYFNLGNELYSANKMDLALNAYKEAYVNKPAFEYGWVAMTVVQIVNCLMRLNRLPEAIEVVADAESVWATSADFQCLKANIYIQQNRFDDAKEVLHNLINRTDHYTHYILSIDFGLLLPHIMLGNVEAVGKNYKQAVFHYMNALNINRMHVEVITKILTVLVLHGSVNDVNTIINKYKWLDEHPLRMHVIRVMLILAKPDYCGGLIEELEESVAKKGFKIKLLIINNQLEQALEILGSTPLNEVNVMLNHGCFDLYDMILLGLIQENGQFLKLIVNMVEGDNKDFVGMLIDGCDVPNQGSNLFVQMLERCIKLGQFEVFEKLLVYRNKFHTDVNLEIGHLLIRNDFVDLAIDFYMEVESTKLDAEACVNMIKAFMEKGLFEDAVSFAIDRINAGQNDFRLFYYSIQLIHEKKSEIAIGELIHAALEDYPDSNWLKDMFIYS